MIRPTKPSASVFTEPSNKAIMLEIAELRAIAVRTETRLVKLIEHLGAHNLIESRNKNN